MFNVTGYQILSLVIWHSDKLLVQRLDNSQYNDNDLLQVKIPLNLPYYNRQTDYERINGEISYEGVYYHYVKRKVARDTLYILCLRNEAKTKLHGKQTDFVKKANDLPGEKQNSSGKKANSLSDHNLRQPTYSFASSLHDLNQPSLFFASPLHTTAPDSDFHPPRVVRLNSAFHFSIQGGNALS